MRKHGMKKRVLAALMTVCMTVGAFPGGVLADVTASDATADLTGNLEPESKYYTFDGESTTEENADIELSKTAVYNAEDDNYTITLNAKAKPKKTHVVFLLDTSTSKNYCTENAVQITRMYDYLENYRAGMTYGELGFPQHYHYDQGAYNYSSYHRVPKNVHEWNYNAQGCNLVDDDIRNSRFDIEKSAIQLMHREIGSTNIKYNFMYFGNGGYTHNNVVITRTYGESSSDDYEGFTHRTQGGQHGLLSVIKYDIHDKFESDEPDTEQVLIIVTDATYEFDKDAYARTVKNTIDSFKQNKVKIYTVDFGEKTVESENQDDKWSVDYKLGFYKDVIRAYATAPAYNLKIDGIQEKVDGGETLTETDEETLARAADEIKKLRATIVDPLGDDVVLDGDVTVSGCNAVEVSDNDTVMASDSNAQLKVTSDSKIELSVDDLCASDEGVTLTYNVKAKDGKSGSVALNGDAVLKYEVGKVSPELEFPVPTAVRSGSIDIKNLLSVTLVHTGSNAAHEDETYELLDGSYTVKTASNATASNATVAYVTVGVNKYLEAYNKDNGNHKVLGATSVKRTLVYNADVDEWELADDENPTITFIVKCDDQKKDDSKKDDDKKDDDKKDDEKQYTNIKFVVKNGSFTENGQTEITKTFEVGTKLTLADIPESRGMSSRYSDQTWDKYPLGYVVGKDGTTFTITYLYQSSSDGDSDSGNGGGSTTTRGRATNANGKSGHWILEGGEFTEDNGRLPSNEYLKIGDTIYGFYTYGFAIDFDRPEYYTDAAIQAKGGYRDATGTWRLNGWWFLYDDGTFPHSEWVYLTWNGRSDWYYFDVDGWMEDNWFYWNNNWYYLHTKYDNTRGHMYTGWHEIDGKWYYFNTASDKGTLGAMLADTTTPDGYRVDANGAWIQ